MATGQPVGSRHLVETTNMKVSPSTVRAELAELEAMGLLTHPHTSAGRVPTDRGYRVFVDRLLERLEPRPRPLPARPLRRSQRGRGRTAGHDRGARAGDPAARARLGAAARGGDGTARRGPAPAGAGRDGGRDHVHGRCHEARRRVRGRGRQRARELGGPVPERAGRQAGRSARPCVRRRFEDPSLSPAERAFLGELRPAFARRRRRRPAALRRRHRGTARRGARGRARGRRARARGAGEAGGAARDPRRGARSAASVRARRRGARPPRPARPLARRRVRTGHASIARDGQPARPAADGLREGDPVGARRRVRALAIRRGAATRRAEPLGTLDAMATSERDYYEILGVSRDADDGEIKKAFRALARKLHPDVSEEPDAEARFKEVVEAYEVLSKPEARQLYDRFGHEGLRSGGFPPSTVRLRQPHRPVLGLLRRRRVRRRGCRIAAAARRGRARRGRDRPRSTAARGVEARGAHADRGAVHDVPRRAGSSPAPSRRRARRAAAPAGSSRSRAARSASSSAPRPARAAAAPGRIVEHPCPRCDGAGRTSRSGRSRSRSPPGIHDGQQIRITGGGHAGSSRRARGRRLRRRPRRAAPDLRARGQRHLLDRRPDDDPGGARRARHGRRRSTARRSSSSRPGRSRARSRVLRGRGMPVLAGLRPRRPPRARERAGAAAG